MSRRRVRQVSFNGADFDGAGDSLQGANLEDFRARGMFYDPALPICLFPCFLGYLKNRKLPGGRPSSLGPLSKAKWKLFTNPYYKWSSRSRDSSSPLEQNNIPLFHVAMALVGAGAIMDPGPEPDPDGPDPAGFYSMLDGIHQMHAYTGVRVNRAIGEMRARLVAGLDPVPEFRWRERGFNTVQRSPEAQYICVQVLLAGSFLIHDARTKVRYRDVWKVADKFEKEVDLKLARHGHLNMEDQQDASQNDPAEPRVPEPKMTDIWDEFWFAYLHYVANRSRKWLRAKLGEQVNLWYPNLVRNPWSDKGNISPEAKLAMETMGRLTQLKAFSDLLFLFTPDEFRRFARPLDIFPADQVDWTSYDGSTPLSRKDMPSDETKRNDVWNSRLFRIRAAFRARTCDLSRSLTGWKAWYTKNILQEAAVIDSHMKEIYFPEDIQPEMEDFWVSCLKMALQKPAWGPEGGGDLSEDLMYQLSLSSKPGKQKARELECTRPDGYSTWGFVGYRLCYKHSDEEWNTFLRRFARAATKWGEGVAGAQDIKSKSRVRWIDGKCLGMAPGDVDAARSHYMALVHDTRTTTFMPQEAFLIADEEGINSFLRDKNEMQPPPARQPHFSWGMGNAYVTAVATRRPRQADEDNYELLTMRGRRGYNGSVKVIADILFPEFFPGILIHGHRFLDMMWSDALVHPHLVYAGYLARRERMWFRALNWMRLAVLEEVVRVLKEKGILDKFLGGKGKANANEAGDE